LTAIVANVPIPKSVFYINGHCRDTISVHETTVNLNEELGGVDDNAVIGNFPFLELAVPLRRQRNGKSFLSGYNVPIGLYSFSIAPDQILCAFYCLGQYRQIK
jgi:hypothetical protein